MYSTDSDLPNDDRLALIILAIAQSLGLLALHKALVHQVWPATDPRWLYALYAVVVGVPIFIYLGAVHWRDRHNAYAAAVLAVLLFWAGWHAGWLAAPDFEQSQRHGSFAPGLVCSLLPALFLLALYFRTWREGGRESGSLAYERLLDHSWRNALTLGFLALFLVVFWVLLALWASLFKVIGIDFFAELFVRSEFVYPVFGLVGGWGLGLIRARVGLVATLRRMCEVLIRALLPIVAFILVIFLGTLPFTGLDSLWKTGYASALLLSLAAILLFFFNAVLSDDDALAMHPLLKGLVVVALVLVPVNAALTAWAMHLRVDQYGWSVDRLWGVVVLAFIAAYSLGYAAIVLRHRGMQVAPLRRLNTVLGATLAATLIVVNTPLIEFQCIAAKSQVERLVAGRTKPADFDARYLRFELGPYGIAQLESLKTSKFIHGKPELLGLITDALAAKERWAQDDVVVTDLDRLRARVDALPGTRLEDEFLLQLGKREKGVIDCLKREVRCAVGDIAHAGKSYRLVVPDDTFPTGNAWRRAATGWERIGEVRRFGCVPALEVKVDRKAAFELIASEYFVLRNGRCLYQVLPVRSALGIPLPAG